MQSNLPWSLSYQSFFTRCFFNVHVLKIDMAESAELYSLAHAVCIPGPATIFQDTDTKPELLNHQSYPFLLCFICFVSIATSPWQFLFATEAFQAVPTDIKVIQ